MSTMITLTAADQIERANDTGRTPVVFIHVLWLLPSSWDRWAALFESAGYAPLTPGWPDDPESVTEAREHPEVFAGKTVGEVADHYAEIIGRLNKTAGRQRPPVVTRASSSPSPSRIPASTVLSARHAAEATAVTERAAGRTALRLTDIVMPGLSGPALAA